MKENKEIARRKLYKQLEKKKTKKIIFNKKFQA